MGPRARAVHDVNDVMLHLWCIILRCIVVEVNAAHAPLAIEWGWEAYCLGRWGGPGCL